MDFQLDNRNVHASTGSVAFDTAKPAVVFLHGAGMDHTVFALQTRYFAYRGRACLAVDFPGHGKSDGPALATVEEMADWVARALDALKVQNAALVGHSMGSMVALSCAARHPEKVRALGLIGTAMAMGVSPDLLNAAAANDPAAFDMVNLWGFGARAGRGGAEAPGLWMTGAGARILAQSAPGVLANDLSACNAHGAIGENAAKVACPTLIVQGSRDMMTPLKSARALAGAIKGARLAEIAGAGHMPMIEREEETRAALATIL